MRVSCRTYAIQIADTVLVNREGTQPEVLTRFSASDWNAVSYELKSEAEDESNLVEPDELSGSDIDMDSHPKRHVFPAAQWH
jgi:hypothetical protein